MIDGKGNMLPGVIRAVGENPPEPKHLRPDMSDHPAPPQPTALARPATDIGALLSQAIDKGIAVEAMEKLVALYERLEANNAAKQFIEAKAKFHRECPAPKRTLSNPQFTKVANDGRRKPSKYADLEVICTTIAPHLHANGFAFRWGDSFVTKDSSVLTTTCILSHIGGHSDESPGSSPVDLSPSKSPSPQQKFASSETYARRSALVNVIGLYTCDDDDDNVGIGGVSESISGEEAAELELLITETGSPRDRLLKWAGVEKVTELPKSKLPSAISKCNAKQKVTQ